MTFLEQACFADLAPFLQSHETLILVSKAEDVLQNLPAGHLKLPDEEALRIARYRSEDDRRARHAAHSLVRHCLGIVLSRQPQDLRFIRDDKGRPFLPGTNSVDFNISHSGSWVAAGVSRAGRIGADVQDGIEPFDWKTVSRAYLQQGEIDTIGALPPSNQAAAALELWCLKEAFLKAAGEGLATPPSQILPLRSGREIEAGKRDTGSLAEGWQLWFQGYELKAASACLPDGSYAAGACEGAAAPRMVRF